MGTNYYVACKSCGTRLKHIGKQSAGWRFKSNIPREKFIDLKLKRNECIMNSYDKRLTKEELLENTEIDWDLHEDGDKCFDAGDNGWC